MVATRCRPEIGGIEAHVGEVAGRLASRGVEVEVLTTDRGGRLPRVERVGAAGSDGGYVVRRFRAWPRHRDWYLSPGLAWAVLRGRHDLVHVQGVHTLVPPLAMLAARARRAPYVLTFHTGGSSSALRERSRGLQFRLLAPLLRRAAALVGVSLFETRRFDEVLAEPGRVRLVRNGGSLPPLRIAPVPDPDLVLSIGRLERYKGHHRAVAALPHLLEQRPGARLEILGAGPYEAELRSLADELGVADRVAIRFVPPEDREAMAAALAGAGLVVLLSDYEAHPVAVMEALAAGRPVVVSRTSGLTELAEVGWAVGVEPDADAATTAAAMAAQLANPVLPPPSSLPTWEDCVDELVDVYDAVLAGEGRPVVAGAG
ncbi:glycosyltransferase [Nocardioides sp. zg-579]|uniref:Glycosyltransferase n=1 Tax=Nocardioides marmotae TaxID=2663857 RepID=A0A6I3J5R0_9ACTN|nr:glycosyltransferase family 4 protein [Nocardioides marmotae]MCR6031015.1 glycosyltransferase [Gordonia jinghuaiqii]MTB94652.1 glycosyltransferase [Nocardioides marmotae]QKE01342.1 glycosyltransferase family 4 protein [Nocardioides marmotae]